VFGYQVLSLTNALDGSGTHTGAVIPVKFLYTNINGLSLDANEPLVSIFGMYPACNVLTAFHVSLSSIHSKAPVVLLQCKNLFFIA
jgi:hypothetical protein